MAHQHQEEERPQLELESNPLFDSLYCEEERWEEEDGVKEEKQLGDAENERSNTSDNNGSCLLPLLLLEQELFWEDDELVSLFSKEQQAQLSIDPALSSARREAVEWMLRVIAHYAFCPLTAVLAVNYLDRFLSSFHFQRDKPWMTQLAAVACLSLAAKVEETQVPLLLDLQVEESKYVFEAKTIQRMELLVLSTLHWKMNPVTPLSFLDHIIRRLGLKNHLHWEFLRRCERLLLSLLSDTRFVRYLPSVLAAATMLNVIDQVEPDNPVEYQNQLMGVLKISKEEVDDCYELIVEFNSGHRGCGQKRKYESIPGSPNGVIEANFSCDSSDDSWAVASSVTSSPEPLLKRRRAQEQQMRVPTLSRVFVDVLGSPQ
ncbi:cyclin-D3-1-like isoform X2 [Macadamia integrifolia]|uniref:cyclin-D3-1-like isoform X2 n=1 Tax=Macadamia integrifolia TaxID=60698 RepID=UPI001C4FEF7B|nr:cyclin-D3-1-like isoform X2 [Macadamia integrifolia]